MPNETPPSQPQDNYDLPSPTPPVKSDKNSLRAKDVIWWYFACPFLLAHVVFWPAFIISTALYRSTDAPYDALITNAVISFGIVAISGGFYGYFVLRELYPDNTNVPKKIIAIHVAGMLFWFPFAVISPCAVYAVPAFVIDSFLS